MCFSLSVIRLTETAREMIKESLPIKCLEAVVLGLYPFYFRCVNFLWQRSQIPVTSTKIMSWPSGSLQLMPFCLLIFFHFLLKTFFVRFTSTYSLMCNLYSYCCAGNRSITMFLCLKTVSYTHLTLPTKLEV